MTRDVSQCTSLRTSQPAFWDQSGVAVVFGETHETCHPLPLAKMNVWRSIKKRLTRQPFVGGWALMVQGPVFGESI
jgi:hypothetical protein